MPSRFLAAFCKDRNRPFRSPSIMRDSVQPTESSASANRRPSRPPPACQTPRGPPQMSRRSACGLVGRLDDEVVVKLEGDDVAQQLGVGRIGAVDGLARGAAFP